MRIEERVAFRYMLWATTNLEWPDSTLEVLYVRLMGSWMRKSIAEFIVHRFLRAKL